MKIATVLRTGARIATGSTYAVLGWDALRTPGARVQMAAGTRDMVGDRARSSVAPPCFRYRCSRCRLDGRGSGSKPVGGGHASEWVNASVDGQAARTATLRQGIHTIMQRGRNRSTLMPCAARSVDDASEVSP